MSADEERGGSPAAGGCVLIVLTGAGFAAVFAASTAAGVLVVWTVGTVALWRAASRRKPVRDTSNPAPPPSPPEAEGELPQVIDTARREGAQVTEFPSGVVVISTPDTANPSRTRIRVLEKPE